MEFNQTSASVADRTRTTNHEDGEAFEPESPELRLTKRVLNNLLEDTFYESAAEQLAAVEDAFDACADTNPEFVLKLAKYARQEENLRQIPQALLVLAANDERTQQYVRPYACSIMSRADEPLEVLAFHSARHGTTLPNCLQQAIEDALHQYNEYQVAKWDQPNRDWQYRDLLNVVHPNPRDDTRDRIFEQVALGELDDYDVEPLRQEDTWENELSQDDDRSKAEAYRDALDNMGLFPRIRQARDMLEAGLTADEIFGHVTDEWIRNSGLYPFRFYQAYRAIRGGSVQATSAVSMPSDTVFGDAAGDSNDDPADTPTLLQRRPEIPASEAQAACAFLEHAIEIAAENLPAVLDDTLVAVDTSGSMSVPIASQSSLDCVEIASLFGALVYQRGADLVTFAREALVFDGDRRDTIPTLMREIQSVDCGGATFGHKVPEALHEAGRDDYEQVVFFTDMQLWGDSFADAWDDYVSEVNPDTSLYLVDLQNYGDLVTPETAHDVYNISGWSENVVDFIDKMEHADGLVRQIEAVGPDWDT